MESSATMRVFVSCQAVDRKPAQDLIFALREAGVDVEHSPRNPLDGADARWKDWYDAGLATALRGCDVFVIVVDEAWDSSTWMAIEAQAGLAALRDGVARRAFFWNPLGIGVRAAAAGTGAYLQHELPREVDDAIRRITAETGSACDGGGGGHARQAEAPPISQLSYQAAEPSYTAIDWLSTADSEYPELTLRRGDLTVRFVDWREQQVCVRFADVIALRWQDEMRLPTGVRDDTAYEVLRSPLVAELAADGAVTEGVTYRHFMLCFNAIGAVLQVVAAELSPDQRG
jgi:hypothetical protein